MSIEPPDFDALLGGQGSERFRELRPAQRAVLEQYVEHHLCTSDLAIELPSGAGKSLVALLIGEAWRAQDRTVAVLTGNKALAAQMEREGNDLGVPVARMEGRGEDISLSVRRTYRRARAIGVMNHWVMFNTNPVVDAADLLIVDDAHLAEGALESLFAMQIDRYAHQQLFSMLVDELAARLPDYASLEDARGDHPRGVAGVELMSYLDQAQVAARVRELIDGAPELLTDVDLRFRWRGVRDRLAECNIYLSQRSITVRPFCLPVQTLARWAEPAQRLYLSATIGDPADLQRRLGCGPITRIGSDADAPTLGRRLVVLNNDVVADEEQVLPRARRHRGARGPAPSTQGCVAVLVSRAARPLGRGHPPVAGRPRTAARANLEAERHGRGDGALPQCYGWSLVRGRAVRRHGLRRRRVPAGGVGDAAAGGQRSRAVRLRLPS